MDWNVCVICGKGESEMKCPADSLQANGLDVYRTFLEDVEQFRDLNCMPVEVNFKNEGGPESFLQNRAKWHKSCRLKFAHSKLTKLQDQLKRKLGHDDGEGSKRKSKRQSMSTADQGVCIFCMEPATWNRQLHSCSTMELDRELKRMATELEDTTLLAKISGGDLVAIEAKYHRNCLSTYRNRYRSVQRASHRTETDDGSRQLEARAFAEIVNYIESSVEDGTYLLKLSELHTVICMRIGLEILGWRRPSTRPD